MSQLDYGLIGNCNVSALIDAHGRMVWACLPRYDGDPVFCALLNGGQDDRGVFSIELQNQASASQHYLRNTAVLVTILRDQAGGVVEITDFAPRFHQYGRMFYPMSFVRRVRPLSGSPVVRVRLNPCYGYGAGTPARTVGSNHIRYITPDVVLRLTTDASVTSVTE